MAKMLAAQSNPVAAEVESERVRRSLAPARQGGPGDPRRADSVRQAALAGLAEVGYRALTMDAVAARAGTGKATIYRQWNSKLDLIIDTCAQLTGHHLAEPDTGSLSGDLREFLNSLAASLSGPIGTAAQTLVGTLPHEPELAAAFRDTFLASQRDALHHILQRANERGQLRSDAPHDMAIELAAATLIHRLMLTGDPLDPTFIDRLVDHVLIPLIGHH